MSNKKHSAPLSDARDEDQRVIDDNEARYREKVERDRAADYDHNHKPCVQRDEPTPRVGFKPNTNAQ